MTFDQKNARPEHNRLVSAVEVFMSRRLNYVHDSGGLCNRIFSFAHLFAFSQSTGVEVVNWVFGRYADYFMGTHSDFHEGMKKALDHKISFRSKISVLGGFKYRLDGYVKPDRVANREENELLDLELLRIEGNPENIQWINAFYTIDNPSFIEFESEVRLFFSPVPERKASINGHIEKLRENVDVLVGVHIRHGDYAHHSGGNMFYEVSEFRTLMDRVEGLIPDKKVGFLVCSNVSQPKAAFDGLKWGFGLGTELEDLYLLAACDYIIGPASTYSQWASFYGEVPLWVHNRKYEELYGIEPRILSIDGFRVHRRGYRKYRSSDELSKEEY